MEFSRKEQLDFVTAFANEHAGLGKALSEATRVRSAQWSQLHGLYEEVDKLAKGKALLPASDLMVELANTIIADAKQLVFRDVYLDRLKLFVPAGNNPNYPDVLLALRVLQQTLMRFDVLLQVETGKHWAIGSQLNTISAALAIASEEEHAFYNGETDVTGDEEETEEEAGAEEEEEEEDDEDVEEDEDDEDVEEDEDEEAENEDYYECVLKQQVVRHLNNAPIADEWFKREPEGYIFDFAKLDRIGIPRYVTPEDGITFVKVINA